jgi:1-acyl-sn-glycerol-3-phosphate acyltransferase
MTGPTRARVLPFETKASRAAKGRRAKSASEKEREDLKRRVEELEAKLRSAHSSARLPEGLAIEITRMFAAGLSGISWDRVARLLAAAHFSWHSEETDEFGYDPKFTEAIRPFLEFMYAVWWRVETTGIERVPGTGPTLVVANHSGVLPWDGPMINVALRHEHPARRHCRMLALDMFALLPFLAPLLARSGAIRANPENAIRILERGELVGVFPEGVKGVGKPFKNRYRLARFGRGGFVRIALKTGATIVPTAVVGAEEIHPNLAQANFIGRPFGLPYFPLTPTFPWLGLLGTIPLPTKWSIDFGEPLDLSRYPKDAADDPILVNRLSELVRHQIQTIIEGRLARRRSIWFG